MVRSCAICIINIGPRCQVIKCKNKSCSKWFHVSCTELDSFQYLYLLDEFNITGVYDWACSSCEPESIKNPAKQNKSFETTLNALFSQHFTDFKREFLESIEQKLQNLNDKIKAVENENRLLKNKLCASNENSITTTSNIIHEIKEQQKRACNIMIFNVPESVKESSDDKIADDKKFVDKLLQPVQLNSGPTKIVRVGKLVDNKNRPLKVSFKDEQSVKDILKLSKTLKSRNIIIRADLTLQQQQHLRGLRTELESRKTSGENNLIIKYINGVPAIITKKN